MHAVMLPLIVTLLLAGCSSTPQTTPVHQADSAVAFTRGVSTPSKVLLEAVSRDSVAQIAVLYPPAHTQLSLAAPLGAGFASVLVADLRAQGYAVGEPATLKQADMDARDSAPIGEYAAAITPAPPMQLQAELVRIASDLYQVRIHLDQQQLARAYIVTPQTAVAAGGWTLRE